MSDATLIPLSIYTESTPNPDTMKFVMNRMITHSIKEYKNIEDANESPLAVELFGFPFVKGVFYSNNFITITKTADASWDEVMLELKEFIRQYIIADKEIFDADAKAAVTESNSSEHDSADVARIKELLDTYVKPAVEMDGGNIIFRSYEEGVVTLGMQGSCSGCPSSTITLKSGIEGLLKRMMPEIKEVVAEAM